MERTKLNLAELWESFKESQKKADEHSKTLISMPGAKGAFDNLNQSWQQREINKQQIKSETIQTGLL